jgi:hypothetical protein
MVPRPNPDINRLRQQKNWPIGWRRSSAIETTIEFTILRNLPLMRYLNRRVLAGNATPDISTLDGGR